MPTREDLQYDSDQDGCVKEELSSPKKNSFEKDSKSSDPDKEVCYVNNAICLPKEVNSMKHDDNTSMHLVSSQYLIYLPGTNCRSMKAPLLNLKMMLT